MSPEKQRIAIATACGWTRFNCATHKWALQYGQPPNACSNSWELPHFRNDLNAMHEAEKGLTYEQKEQFVFWLNHIHPSADIHTAEKKRDLRLDVFDLCHSPASQRAEAFLRTLGLWEDAQ